MEGRRLGRRVAANTAAQVAGRAVILALAAVSIVLITRYLGPSSYGRYALALSYIQLFGVLADVGLFTIVVREISKRPEQTSRLVGNAMTLRALVSTGIDFNRALKSLRDTRGFLLGGEGLVAAEL